MVNGNAGYINKADTKYEEKSVNEIIKERKIKKQGLTGLYTSG
jgi:hypothetical protein